jgi:hypothetical protein
MRATVLAVAAGGWAASVAATDAAADVVAFDLVKSRYYVQGSAAPPVTPVVWLIESYVDIEGKGQADDVTLNGDSYEEIDIGTWDFVRDFATKAELDAAYPSAATHTIGLGGGSLGTLSEDVLLPQPEVYPAAPAFSAATIAALDGADPAAGILVEWATADASTDAVFVSLYDIAAQDFVVDSDFVTGDSFLIDGSLLEPGTDYELSLTFANVELVQGTPDPGFGLQSDSFQGYLSGTAAYFTTGDGSLVLDFSAGVLKGVQFRQVLNNTPAAIAEMWNFEAFFDAGVGAMAFGEVLGGLSPTPMGEYEPGQWDVFDAGVGFGSKSELDSAFPSDQTYTMVVGGGTLGDRSQPFFVGADGYPAAPYLIDDSFDALQGMDPNQEISISWSAPDVSVDAIGVAIERPDTGEVVAESIFLPGVAELVVPPGSFEAGVTYETILTFANVTTRPGDGAPGFDAIETLLEGFLSETLVEFTTASGCPADLAAPFGVLNFFDLAAYIGLYNAGDPAADLAAPFGSLNFFDVAAYIAAYNAGCP